jgi:hypothetical protein
MLKLLKRKRHDDEDDSNVDPKKALVSMSSSSSSSSNSSILSQQNNENSDLTKIIKEIIEAKHKDGLLAAEKGTFEMEHVTSPDWHSLLNDDGTEEEKEESKSSYDFNDDCKENNELCPRSTSLVFKDYAMVCMTKKGREMWLLLTGLKHVFEKVPMWITRTNILISCLDEQGSMMVNMLIDCSKFEMYGCATTFAAHFWADAVASKFKASKDGQLLTMAFKTPDALVCQVDDETNSLAKTHESKTLTETVKPVAVPPQEDPFQIVFPVVQLHKMCKEIADDKKASQNIITFVARKHVFEFHVEGNNYKHSSSSSFLRFILPKKQQKRQAILDNNEKEEEWSCTVSCGFKDFKNLIAMMNRYKSIAPSVTISMESNVALRMFQLTSMTKIEHILAKPTAAPST